MQKAKREKLEAMGYKVGTVEDFLGGECMEKIETEILKIEEQIWFCTECKHEVLRHFVPTSDGAGNYPVRACNCRIRPEKDPNWGATFCWVQAMRLVVAEE